MRRPRAERPRRMQPLATLPLFFGLVDRRAVVIGGSEPAVWKAELLSAAGARVAVLATEPCEEMEALAADPPGGRVDLQRRAWSPDDLDGAVLVVAAAADEEEAQAIFAAARAMGLPVNVIDKPAFCTFQFGAIVNRSPLVVGISTDGAAPVLGQAIRSRIEALLPAGFARWAQAAKTWRAELGTLGVGAAVRRRVWEAFAGLALRSPDRAPGRRDWEGLLRDAHARGSHSRLGVTGHVTLVGAGPGDPELMTLKAVRALRTADVILFDDLVAPEVLDFARREARRLLVGKTGHRPSCKQEEINVLMVSLARAGKRVVRLKAGDPMIFGRAGEEIDALERAGVPFDVVPGISAAQGAAAGLKVSLSHRSVARRVQFVTGHAHDGRLPQDLDLAALADPNATTAVYMPLGTLPDLIGRLTQAGVEASRPVCAVFNATRADERIVAGSVGTIVDRLQRADITGPCVLIVGEVLQSRASARDVDVGASARNTT
jgi:uroporphyrin-III C-methyltransferase/precorrin-2 dehydrogenase/sirohydrochlorin ferrochelatase